MCLKIILCSLTWLMALPVMAIVDLSVALTPEHPNFLDPLTIHVTFTSSNIEFDVESSVVDDVISIRLSPIPCLVTCPPFERTIDVDLDPQPQGAYDLEILTGNDLLLTERLIIDGPVDHPFRPGLDVVPEAPSDNDAIRLLIPMLLPDDKERPVLSGLRREGQDVIVDVMSSPKQGPEGQEELVAVLVELGQLEPGMYRVFVYLNEGPSFPLDTPSTQLVALRALEVVDGPDAVNLQDRFVARVSWTDFSGISGSGHPVPGPTQESTLFTFFSPGNWELLVKVLDGCAINGHFWVLTAGATNVEYTIEILDTVTGAEWTYTNPLGTSSPAITDTEAFSSCSPSS